MNQWDLNQRRVVCTLPSVDLNPGIPEGQASVLSINRPKKCNDLLFVQRRQGTIQSLQLHSACDWKIIGKTDF